MAKLADAADLKSAARKGVGVQVPLRAPSIINILRRISPQTPNPEICAGATFGAALFQLCKDRIQEADYLFDRVNGWTKRDNIPLALVVVHTIEQVVVERVRLAVNRNFRRLPAVSGAVSTCDSIRGTKVGGRC